MIDTLFPYWGPPGTVHAALSVDFVLGSCPPDMKSEMLRCMQWTKEDCTDWASRNWKGNGSQLSGIEAKEPPPTVFIHATEYIPLQNLDANSVAIFDQFRNARNGWDFFPHESFIVATWQIPTHHFGLFDRENVSEKVFQIFP